MKRVFITGSAGFIGFHLSNALLNDNFCVHGYDGITDYYDINLKLKRESILLNHSNFSRTNGMLEDHEKLYKCANEFNPDIIIHLAAQAGVRHSLKNPRSYIESNLIGTFNIMEVAKKNNIKHFLMASTSSVYGANLKFPFTETDKADNQLTMYAATKKSNESMTHSYSYLWKIPTTVFRFFTVYGPWGRPDMALFKFVAAILKNKPIDIYNDGNMYRDFTYVEDLVYSIKSLIDVVPLVDNKNKIFDKDSISPIAPYRIVNIGSSKQINLLDFIETIENILKKKAIRNYLPLQKGDVQSTLADTSLLQKLIGQKPETSIHKGITNFVEWYLDYYDVNNCHKNLNK